MKIPFRYQTSFITGRRVTLGFRLPSNRRAVTIRDSAEALCIDVVNQTPLSDDTSNVD